MVKNGRWRKRRKIIRKNWRRKIKKTREKILRRIDEIKYNRMINIKIQKINAIKLSINCFEIFLFIFFCSIK